MTITALALSEFQALAASGGAPPSAQLVENAGRFDRWRLAVQRGLANAHLVEVASELAIAHGCDASTLEALGVPVDLLECFPGWRQGSRAPFRPQRSGLRLAPAGAAVPLGTLRLQLSPTRGTVPYALLLLRDLLRQLDSATRFVVVVEPGADLEALRKLSARLHPSANARVRFVPLPCITVFAQDNARAARDADGKPVLLVPRDFRAGAHRAEDALDPVEAGRAFGISVHRSSLYWEGGNIVHDETRCFVGIDTLAENSSRLGLSHGEILTMLEAEFGLP